MDGKCLVIMQACFYAWIKIILYLDKIAFFMEVWNYIETYGYFSKG